MASSTMLPCCGAGGMAKICGRLPAVQRRIEAARRWALCDSELRCMRRFAAVQFAARLADLSGCGDLR